MPQELLNTLAIVTFFSIVGNRLVDALVTPLFDHFKWNKFFVLYISWFVTTGLVLISNANLFSGYISSVILGRILTGVVGGGGANFIHDLFDKTPQPTP